MHHCSESDAPVHTCELLDKCAEWPEIIDAVLPRLNGHKRAWFASVVEGLKHRAFLYRTRCGNETTGILPLSLVSGPIFGRFLVSMPYVNTGGVWAKDTSAATMLIDRACDLADQLNVKYLELRHEVPIEHPRLNFEHADKVHMRLTLPDSPETLMSSFKSKLRSQIKKSGQYGLSVSFGGAELLNDFYSVFSRNMRDLGTPVFPKLLFHCILREFDQDAEIFLVRNDAQPVAAGLLVHDGNLSEVPSASCLREFNRTNANMLMYRHLLERAIERGSRTFDFGRSTKGSGTYRFKAQWGAKPHPCVWQYYVRKGSPADMRPDDEGKQRLIKIWRRLPVSVTRIIGPQIVRGIP